MVTDSAGVAIDAGFTYEIVNDTCNEDPSDDQLDRMLSEMSFVTSEHTSANGETIYRTSFGGTDTGFIGTCNFDSASFLADYDPDSDFDMADTASVEWGVGPSGYKKAIGLNFLRSADYQVLGVPSTCNNSSRTPVQFTDASQLTL